jgi:RNA polymerase sigma-70 factor (ECF subfamily)
VNFFRFYPEYVDGEAASMDDRQLWEGIRRKDASAFDTLYRSCGAGLLGFLNQFLGNHQAAEDVAQETFAGIWQHPNGFDPQRGTLRSYVFGAGRKRAAEWWRKQKPQSHSTTEPVEGCKAETQSLIGNAFEKLPAEQRTLLWLREVEGQSYAELAEILEIPEGTVRSRLFAARKALRQIWHTARNI